MVTDFHAWIDGFLRIRGCAAARTSSTLRKKQGNIYDDCCVCLVEQTYKLAVADLAGGGIVVLNWTLALAAKGIWDK